MKRIIRTAFFIFLSLFINSCRKTSSVTVNTNYFGTVIGDGNPLSIGEVIQLDNDEYYVCGTAAVGKYGMSDGFVMKLDRNYNIIWYKNFGGAKQDFIESMALDEDENIMIAGSSYSFGVSLDTTNNTKNSLFYMVYLDKSGNKIWEKTHRGNDTSSAKNIHNKAHKVIYTKNKTFCIAGMTCNYSPDQTADGYAIGIDNSGKVLWNSTYFAEPVPTGGYQDHESIDDAALCDDGNIMLLLKLSDTTSIDVAGTPIKIPLNAAGFKPNRKLWQGTIIKHLAESPYSYNSQIRMQSISKDKVAICQDFGSQNVVNDPAQNQLYITDNLGQISNKKSFNHLIFNMRINRSGDKLLITGYFNNKPGLLPCWVLTDLDGNIIKENYFSIGEPNVNQMKVRASFLNQKNEVVSFFEFSEASRTYINVIRFNQKGEILK